MRRRRPLPLLTLGCVLSVALSACGAGQGSAPSVVGATIGFGHVHGLGIDPADGAPYAATHYGLFLVPPTGPPRRVGNRLQDTMGFTVAGAGTFLGSGHPDFAADPDLPALLGLIRSSDAGQSWSPVSLLGEADLHALRTVGDAVFGWDSGTGALLASADGGGSWETRSVLALRDFVVDPGNLDHLLATTATGLMVSTDGARTWTPVPGAPPLSVLAWPASDRLFGSAPDGTVATSTDRGATWTPTGSVAGSPAAMTAAPESGLVAIATEDGVAVSTDGGSSFVPRGGL